MSQLLGKKGDHFSGSLGLFPQLYLYDILFA